ncbi:MAG: ABC transporter substrate-binding protein [Gammaproteobacteria bacterium]
MKWRWLLLMVVLVVAGCSRESPHALKVATNAWLGYEPLYLARYIGAYPPSVDMVQLPSATDVMRALRNGNVDVAALTLDEAMLLESQGEDLVLLMAMDFSDGADVVLGRSPVQSLKDLKGQRVGVENTGLGALVLSAALEMAGLTLGDIKVITLPVDQHLTAYTAGDVDAVVTFEPIATQLRNQGANLLFDSSAVPGLVVDVLVARQSIFPQHGNAIVDLLDGYYQARRYMVSNAPDAHSFIARRIKLSADELSAAFAGLRLPTLQENLDWLEGAPSPFEQNSVRLRELMQQRGLLLSGSPGSLKADSQWLRRVRP